MEAPLVGAERRRRRHLCRLEPLDGSAHANADCSTSPYPLGALCTGCMHSKHVKPFGGVLEPNLLRANWRR